MDPRSTTGHSIEFGPQVPAEILQSACRACLPAVPWLSTCGFTIIPTTTTTTKPTYYYYYYYYFYFYFYYYYYPGDGKDNK